MTDLHLDAFLTAYDPSDLPGMSIDPLGFETGYLFLAEKLLPDLTNVANRPRYFGVLCAGIYLAEVSPAETLRTQYRKRLECALRLERLWALANVLSSGSDETESLSAHSVRGITYAESRAQEIHDRGQKQASPDYKLLSRQTQYGMVGIYAAVAERLRMLERKTLTLTPDLGGRLGAAFVQETDMPREVRESVASGGPVSVKALEKWGARSHIAGAPGKVESSCYAEAFRLHGVRLRMGNLLLDHPVASDIETELSRLARIAAKIRDEEHDRDLYEALRAVLSYESCYRWVLLGFERLLWLCRSLPAGSVPAEALHRDTVLVRVMKHLRTEVHAFSHTIADARTDWFHKGDDALADAHAFLQEIAEASGDAEQLAGVILKRHEEVQSGKFDRGRRKMPWVERKNGQLSLTLTHVGGRRFEVTEPEDILPHYYRTAAADEFLWSAGGL